ncbi:hypothetical protein TWF569_010786 [Orbilia oligospora]|nr:hypothetical protein TWF706_009612 [Orbilia oligospora]KAF3132803.1 hypothetical protein TWF569_010786 [Orbilia oligospora]
MRQFSPHNIFRVFLYLSLSSSCLASLSARQQFQLLLYLMGLASSPTVKRDTGSINPAEGTFWLRDTPAKQVLEKLNKRQDGPSTCDCYEPLTETYSGTITPTYFALPFQSCDVRDVTSNLCPTDFICACQQNGTSMCLPTAVQTETECGTPYSGPTTFSLQDFTWALSSPLAEFAFPSEQCGGSVGIITTLAWRTEQTKCPRSQSCVCESASLHAKCRDIELVPPGLEEGECLTTCKYEFRLDVPAPTATAILGGQCGGRCWPGPRNCPSSATCFTETGPTPGGYAECGFTNPARKLKVRRDHEVLVGNLPARVQAMATPIYF